MKLLNIPETFSCIISLLWWALCLQCLYLFLNLTVKYSLLICGDLNAILFLMKNLQYIEVKLPRGYNCWGYLTNSDLESGPTFILVFCKHQVFASSNKYSYALYLFVLFLCHFFCCEDSWLVRVIKFLFINASHNYQVTVN